MDRATPVNRRAPHATLARHPKPQEFSMTHAVSRSLVERFCNAYAVRDADKVAEFFDDDIEWTISGPVEYLTFCGTHRGKDNVLDLIRRRIPDVIRTFSFVPESIVIDGNQLAMLHRQASRRAADGRVINFKVANFMRFNDDKIVSNLSLLDTFDAVEQVLGHRIELDGIKHSDAGNLVAV
jgi:ketosteroid isomerase-like protein